jgi:hypothetical protein
MLAILEHIVCGQPSGKVVKLFDGVAFYTSYSVLEEQGFGWVSANSIPTTFFSISQHLEHNFLTLAIAASALPKG